MIEVTFLSKEDTINYLPTIIKEYYNVGEQRIKEQLTPFIDMLRDDIKMFVEYPYVDKFYRDTYYNFYSKKHSLYDRDSFRISFFKNTVDEDSFYDIDNLSTIQELFFGYITIRPTTYKIIGHSFISPKALKKDNFVCCLNKEELLINGLKLEVHSFPFIAQDNESITCSESALMNIMDYFSHKYPDYSFLLPSHIQKILSKQSFERQLPSRGLQTEFISYVLKKIGFGTVVYSTEDKDNNTYGKEDFKNLLYTYIESGIPVIATLASKSSHHAVIVMGREDISEEKLISNNIIDGKQNKDMFLFSEIFTNILIMNDNHQPFESVEFDNPLIDSETGDHYHIKSFIVPLYSKVHLEAYQVKGYVSKIISVLSNDEQTNIIKLIPQNKSYILRCYLSSTISYKDYIIKSDISNDMKAMIIDKSMPKFIWVCEIIEGEKIGRNQKIKSIIILDATESGLSGHLLLATDSEHLIIKIANLFEYDEYSTDESLKSSGEITEFHDAQIYHIYQFNKQNFITFTNNLKGKHTKWLS